MVRRFCRFTGCRCYRVSCSVFSSSGDVSCCSHHLNPFGFFMRRKVAPAFRSAFSKHSKAGRRGMVVS